MTLLEIISSALEQQGKTSDAQVVQEWRDKFTQLANEGLIDLAQALKLRRTDTVTIGTDRILDIENGIPDTDDPDRRHTCLKILGITKDGRPVRYGRGPATYRIKVDAEGPVEIEYRYLPATLSNDTDEPGVPERLHPLLVDYVLGKDVTTNDVSTQQRASAFFQLYAEGKTQAERMYGEPEFYGIKNKWEI